MKSNQLRSMISAKLTDLRGGQLRVGFLVGLDLQGRPIVDFPGNTLGPLVARALDEIARGKDVRRLFGSEVLLVFENEDGSLPIIVGFVRHDLTGSNSSIERDSQDNVTIHGKTLHSDAKECLTLRCGKSSIVLYADGRIVLKGRRLLSRASEVNKIKGAVVAVN